MEKLTTRDFVYENRVWIEADTVGLNCQRARLRVVAIKLYTGHLCVPLFEKQSVLYVHSSIFNISVYSPFYTTWFGP